MKLKLVTGNKHKLEEYRHGLERLGIDVELLKADCEEIQTETLQNTLRSKQAKP